MVESHIKPTKMAFGIFNKTKNQIQLNILMLTITYIHIQNPGDKNKYYNPWFLLSDFFS